MEAMMAGTVLHRRHFIIDTQAHRVHEEWLSLALAHGLCLSYCPDLDAHRFHDAESRQWLVLGVAHQPSRALYNREDYLATKGRRCSWRDMELAPAMTAQGGVH